MNADMGKIPHDQKLARHVLTTGAYPQGFENQDHASKLLFIFGQNLTDSERIQVAELRDQYNRGAYAEVIATFRGKSNAEMWGINNNPGNPLHQQLVNAQQMLGEKDWNKWTWEVKKLVEENGKPAFKKMPYEQAYAGDMAFYRQCRGEFAKAGLYGSSAMVDGEMTTFAARLVSIRGWGSTAGQTNIAAPPTNLTNLPADKAPADIEFDVPVDAIDGGADISGAPDGSLGLNKGISPNNPYSYSQAEVSEIDAGWDEAETELTEADFEKVNGQEVLAKADIIDEAYVISEADFEEVNGQEVLAKADIIDEAYVISEADFEEVDGKEVLGKSDIIEEQPVLTAADIINTVQDEIEVELSDEDIIEEAA